MSNNFQRCTVVGSSNENHAMNQGIGDFFATFFLLRETEDNESELEGVGDSDPVGESEPDPVGESELDPEPDDPLDDDEAVV